MPIHPSIHPSIHLHFGSSFVTVAIRIYYNCVFTRLHAPSPLKGTNDTNEFVSHVLLSPESPGTALAVVRVSMLGAGFLCGVGGRNINAIQHRTGVTITSSVSKTFNGNVRYVDERLVPLVKVHEAHGTVSVCEFVLTRVPSHSMAGFSRFRRATSRRSKAR